MAKHRKAWKEQVQASATALTYDMVRFLKGPLGASEGRPEKTESTGSSPVARSKD